MPPPIAAGALAIVAADLLGLVLLTPPGEMGADIVVGSAQRFRCPHGLWRSPRSVFRHHATCLNGKCPAASSAAASTLPAAPALRLATANPRAAHPPRKGHQQHLHGASPARRGRRFLRGLARPRKSPAASPPASTCKPASSPTPPTPPASPCATKNFFDTITIETGPRTAEIFSKARAKNFNFRPYDDSTLSIALDETVTTAELQTLCEILGATPGQVPASIPETLTRKTEFLTTRSSMNTRSETAMLRYLKTLEDRDIALNRGMIPLGSCTMKLNAHRRDGPHHLARLCIDPPLRPTRPGPGLSHPHRAPKNLLARATGLAEISLQPNAGSQGEYAGLLAIRAYHKANGNRQRLTCLIPSSAHGTNPASAAMAGLKIVVVGCDQAGNIDLADLREKAEKYADTLAALMVTYHPAPTASSKTASGKSATSSTPMAARSTWTAPT